MIEPLRLVTTEPQLTAFIPLTIPRDDIRKVMGPGLAELKTTLAEQNVAITGPWFTHHLRNPGDIFDFEISFPVGSAVAPANRVKPGEWPATKVARTVYHGGFEGLGAAWGEFMQQIKAGGHEVVDGLWERYVVGPETSSDPAAWRTELSKPLAV